MSQLGSTTIDQIYQSIAKFLYPLTAEETYKAIVDEARRLVKSDVGTILLEKDGLLHRVYASSPEFYKIIPRESGYTYKTFRNNRPYSVSFEEERRWHPDLVKLGIQSVVLVPLSYRGETKGVLTLESFTKKQVTNRQLNMLRLFGSMASLAIQKTELYEEAKEALERRDESLAVQLTLERIHKAVLKFSEPLTLEEAQRTIVSEAIKLVGADYGSLFLEQYGQLQRVYASEKELYKTKIRKRGYTYQAYTLRKSFVTSINKIEKIHPEIKDMGIKSTIFIPLSYRNKTIGVLSVDSLENEKFSQRELEILKLFGSLASLAVRKAQLYKEMKEAVAIRDLFISMAAHEFRTPLTSISGYIQLLYAKMGKQDSTEARWIQQLYYESKRLTTLVGELLETDKIRLGQFAYTWKECHLREIVKRAIDAFMFSFPNRSIVVEGDLIEADDSVIGDYDKLLQVMSNLLENAAKFSSSDTPVTIQVIPRSSQILVRVSDKGRGIAKKDMPYIFERFYKGEDRKKEGMGLGLFLAKIIIRQHHGTIAIHSKERQGTRVEIKLPRAKLLSRGEKQEKH